MKKSKTDLYLIIVWNDVEPELHGPFYTQQERDNAAKEICLRDPEGRNGLFRLDQNARLSGGGLTVTSFSGAETEEWRNIGVG